MLALATAVALALSAGLGTATGRADVGGVYFDANQNAAAGDPDFLFNATFTGTSNIGLGRTVMPNLTTGSNNVATGTDALFTNETGSSNVATGFGALFQNTGSRNIALGTNAGRNLTTGSNNIALGTNGGLNLTTGSNNIALGNAGVAGEAGTIRIGNPNRQTRAFIAGIRNTTIGRGTKPVVVRSNGQLGVAPSSSMSTASLAATVRDLTTELNRQQRQIERLRRQVKGG
jgi:hypothetical protein